MSDSYKIYKEMKAKRMRTKNIKHEVERLQKETQNVISLQFFLEDPEVIPDPGLVHPTA